MKILHLQQIHGVQNHFLGKEMAITQKLRTIDLELCYNQSNNTHFDFTNLRLEKDNF